jgi:hypothetical protein
MSLRQSTTAERPLQASKWLQSQALLSKEELAGLFQFLEESHTIYLYACGVVCSKENEEISKQEFLETYGSYVDKLRQGEMPDLTFYRTAFSPVMTVTTDALFTIPVAEDKQIIRVSEPIVQLQAHNMDYSTLDKKFHSMVFGKDSIPWGLQFSYPQLYQDNQTKQVEIIKKSSGFPNTALFQLLQKWMRQHTIPTPFLAEGTLINVPIRLGKNCLEWINRHPQLAQKHLSVKI